MTNSRRSSTIHFGFYLPDDTAERFDSFTATRGGRSAVLRRLVEQYLTDEGVPVDPAPTPALVHGVDVLVPIPAEDLPALDDEADRTGMTRAQWIRACVLGCLRRGRQFNPIERRRLATIEKELRQVAQHVGRAAKRVERLHDHDDLEPHVDALVSFEAKAERLAYAVREGYRGNDEYWGCRDDE